MHMPYEDKPDGWEPSQEDVFWRIEHKILVNWYRDIHSVFYYGIQMQVIQHLQLYWRFMPYAMALEHTENFIKYAKIQKELTNLITFKGTNL